MDLQDFAGATFALHPPTDSVKHGNDVPTFDTLERIGFGRRRAAERSIVRATPTARTRTASTYRTRR